MEERSERLRSGVIAEVLWGQYALFLYIRIQDDLLDRHLDDLRLVFVADRFLLESLESFQRVGALDKTFWGLYRQCVRETVDGILEVRRLEQEPGRFTAEHLDLHARVSSIFKLGAAAVCCLHGRAEEMTWLSDFQDRLAVFSQIRDDLEDLTPDLDDGRFTWVANTLLVARAGEAITLDERARRLADGLTYPDRAAPVLGELRRVARAAADVVPKSAPRSIRDLLPRLQTMPDELEQALHEARVRWVFGEALAGRK